MYAQAFTLAALGGVAAIELYGASQSRKKEAEQ
jgi:hypothetical protein